MKKIVSQLVGILLLAGTVISASATTIHSLGDQDPTAFGFHTNNIFFGNARGWRFTAGAADIEVTQLGIAPVTDGSYTLTLWDFATHTELAQTTLGSVFGADWNWANLESPVQLQAGHDYLVMGISNTPGAAYYFSNALPSSWYPTGAIQYDDMRYCNNCTADTFPTSALNHYQYGLVDIGYEVGGAASNVPEPSSIAMLGLGLAALTLIRRKKSM